MVAGYGLSYAHSLMRSTLITLAILTFLGAAGYLTYLQIPAMAEEQAYSETDAHMRAPLAWDSPLLCPHDAFDPVTDDLRPLDNHFYSHTLTRFEEATLFKRALPDDHTILRLLIKPAFAAPALFIAEHQSTTATLTAKIPSGPHDGWTPVTAYTIATTALSQAEFARLIELTHQTPACVHRSPPPHRCGWHHPGSGTENPDHLLRLCGMGASGAHAHAL